jgi:methionyl-tRNA formyltransferase
MKIAILTSPNQWFIPYAEELHKKIKNSDLFLKHENLIECYDVVLILSYHRLIPKGYLNKNRHNIVIHASALPQGKGWSPMFWQILEGKNRIPFSMFEVTESVDDGDIYMQKTLTLTGYELNRELREKQAKHTIEMCLEFLENYDIYKNPKKQIGEESFYKKRGKKNSQIDINQSLKEQFNLLRIVDNEEYPAFFEIDKIRYILRIEKVEDETIKKGS